MDAFVMLQELLEQEQFELIFPERSISGQPDIRLVYLMNDAVESFLVFHNARMTGEYRPDYEGEISASMSCGPSGRFSRHDIFRRSADRCPSV